MEPATADAPRVITMADAPAQIRQNERDINDRLTNLFEPISFHLSEELIFESKPFTFTVRKVDGYFRLILAFLVV